jgi:hypothetical protein
MESGKTPARHPQDEANFVSRLFLWWITPLLWKGWRHPLQQDDLHPVRDEDQSCKLTEHLGEKWEQEKDAAKRGIVFFVLELCLLVRIMSKK